MIRILLLSLYCLVTITFSLAQSVHQQKVFTQDIDNFRIAFDSIQTAKDSMQQLNIIQILYIDKGTEAQVKAFLKKSKYY